MPKRPDAESLRLLELLRQKLRRSGRSQRNLERELGMSHGTLGSLLRGRIELRIRHITLLGEALGFKPAEFFLEAYGGNGGGAPPSGEPTLEELRTLRALVLEVVREELDRRAAGA